MNSVVDSEHVALFMHGELAHSSTSTSQLPLSKASAPLSLTVQDAVYSEMKPYSHQPLVYPGWQVQR